MDHVQRFVAYVMRQHRVGRRVEDILGDPYLRNRLLDEQCVRLVERPELIRAVAADTAAVRATVRDAKRA